MYELSVEQHFDAAHFLRGYQGRCEALHGHRFRAVVKATATVLDDIGLAYDFTRLKAHLSDVLQQLDHACLNEVPPFDRLNPSSENLAREIYQQLKPKLAGTPVSLSRVEVWESPESGAAYVPD